jgi:myo-inositol-1(or 4)-monophosphatase
VDQDDARRRIATISDIARAAADCILAIVRSGDVGSRAKTSALDLVTRADEESEAMIRTELGRHFPGEAIVGEEYGGAGAADGTMAWAVDPLDGTANFVLGIPHWCVSIGCLQAGRSVAGVIYDPLRDELFAASEDHGAFLNGRRLHRGHTELEVSTWAIGLSEDIAASRRSAWTGNLRPRIGRERAMGSLALDLAWTAAGRFDAFFYECGLNPWDYGAGEILCVEAGAELLRVRSDPPFSAALLALPRPWREVTVDALELSQGAVTLTPAARPAP